MQDYGDLSELGTSYSRRLLEGQYVGSRKTVYGSRQAYQV